jgi:CRP-like cAMP-binding protein
VTTTELRDLPILHGLSDAGLARLTACGELRARPGQVLALEDDAGAGAFLLVEGTVAVELRSRTFEVGPGQVVGELSLLVPDAGRVARLRAATAVRCVPIAREEFIDLVESEPTFAVSLLRELARRLVEVPTSDNPH